MAEGPCCNLTISWQAVMLWFHDFTTWHSLVLGFNGKIGKSQDGAISRKDRQSTAWRDFTGRSADHRMGPFPGFHELPVEHISHCFIFLVLFGFRFFFVNPFFFFRDPFLVPLGDRQTNTEKTNTEKAPYSKNYVHQIRSSEVIIKNKHRKGSL